MNRVHALLLLLFSLATAPASAATIQACADQAEMPPFVYAERVHGQRSGHVVGASVDLLNLIGARQGWQVEVQLLPWARCLALVADHRVALALNTGQADAAASKLLLSDAYFTMHNVYFYSRRETMAGQYLINPTLRGMLVDGTLVSQPLPGSPLRELYFGVSASGAEAAKLLQTINAGLMRLDKTRELDKLLSHYLEQ